jgi:hypothetical protein
MDLDMLTSRSLSIGIGHTGLPEPLLLELDILASRKLSYWNWMCGTLTSWAWSQFVVDPYTEVFTLKLFIQLLCAKLSVIGRIVHNASLDFLTLCGSIQGINGGTAVF